MSITIKKRRERTVYLNRALDRGFIRRLNATPEIIIACYRYDTFNIEEVVLIVPAEFFLKRQRIRQEMSSKRHRKFEI